MVELKSFPYDSMLKLNEESGEMEQDREYAAKIFQQYFSKFLSNGVYFGNYKSYGENSMKVILDGGMNVKVKKGAGIIEGVDYELEEDTIIAIERPSVGNEVYKVVVQKNNTLDTRISKLYCKLGDLIRDDNIYEICLAEVTAKSISNITAEDIKDTRLDANLCGIVNSLISVDGEELYQKFKHYINTITDNLMLNNQDNVCTGKITSKQFIGDVDGNAKTANVSASCSGNARYSN